MNTPSIEICKKLKEIWYPQEIKEWYVLEESYILRSTSEIMPFWPPDNYIYCHTVTEFCNYMGNINMFRWKTIDDIKKTLFLLINSYNTHTEFGKELAIS